MTIYSNGKSIELSSNNSSSSLDIYSTEEQIVGTWIDGRPLYRKTFSLTTPSKITQDALIGNYPSEGDVKSINGYCIDSNGYAFAIPLVMYTNNIVAVITVYTKAGGIYITINHVAYVNIPIYITLEYTKTTDAKNSNDILYSTAVSSGL